MKVKIKIFLLLLMLSFSILSLLPQTVLGQTANVGDSAKPGWTGIVPCGRNTGTAEEQAPCTLCHLVVGFQRLVQYGMYMVVTLALVGIFCAGVMYMVSTGDENMMTQAKGFLKVSLIGFAVVISGWLIVNVTMWALGTKGDLGIGVVKWNQFTCDTKSTQGTGGSAIPTTIPGTTSTPPVSPAPAPGTLANPDGADPNQNPSPVSAPTPTIPTTPTPTTPTPEPEPEPIPPPASSNVDLVLSSDGGWGSAFEAGMSIERSVTVQNQGTDPSGPFVIVGDYCGNLVTQQVSNLNGGESQSYSLSAIAGESASIHSYCLFSIRADANNQVKETNESNNSWSRSSLRAR